jgi:hypothetical protein
MEKGAQATMAGRCQTFREAQGGHRIETGLVEAIHPGIAMAAVEQDCLRASFARPIETILNEDAGLGGHKTMPSRSTSWIHGMA